MRKIPHFADRNVYGDVINADHYLILFNHFRNFVRSSKSFLETYLSIVLHDSEQVDAVNDRRLVEFSGNSQILF